MKKLQQQFGNKLLEIIEKYDEIALFHHINPDPDTLGAQFGFYQWLKDNFKNKKIFLIDCDGSFLIKKFNKISTVNNINYKKCMGIVFDVNHMERISKNDLYEKMDFKVCIDHHKDNTKYKFDLAFIDENISSTCEVLGILFQGLANVNISREACEYLTYGLITDTGRFLHTNTRPNTFKIAALFMEKGVNFSKIYNSLYQKTIKSVRISGYIQQNFINYKNMNYFIFTKKLQDKFAITFEESKLFVWCLREIEGINVNCYIIENKNKNNYSISLRSKDLNIRDFATKYNGGGHLFAAGVKANNLQSVMKIIEDLKKYANK